MTLSMNQVIVWSLIIGTGIFGIGLTSALASRKERRRINRSRQGRSAAPGPGSGPRPNALNPAAGGNGNILASGSKIGTESEENNLCVNQ